MKMGKPDMKGTPKTDLGLLDYFKSRMDWMDANPLRDPTTFEVTLVPDQRPMTIEHHVMNRVLSLEPFATGQGWSKLRAWRAEAGSTISREYPGFWIRAIITELEK